MNRASTSSFRRSGLIDKVGRAAPAVNRQQFGKQRKVAVQILRRWGEKRLELVKFGLVAVGYRETGRMFQLIDNGIQSRLVTMRRALKQQPVMRLALDFFLKGESKARLADAGLSVDQR
jgi:hypothetical protein